MKFTSSWKMHKKTGMPLCWLFQKGNRDSQEFVALIYDGEDCAVYEGNGRGMHRCTDLYCWDGPMNLDRDDSPYELHVEVRFLGDREVDPVELDVDANKTFSWLHRWRKDEVIRFVDPRYFMVTLDEASNILRVTPTAAFVKSRIRIETLKIGVVGLIAQASDTEPYIALNLALDEAVDERPAKSVVVGVDYDGSRNLANLARQVVDERATRESNWYWGHGEEFIEAEPSVLLPADWYLRCHALVRIGSSYPALAAVRRYKKMKVNPHVYEYDFPLFG